MRIRLINLRNVPLGASLTNGTERKVRFAFTRFSQVIARVDVRFRDENGPRGGRDQAVTVTVIRHAGTPVVGSAIEEEAGAAMALAIERAERGLARQLRRARRHRRLQGGWSQAET